MEKFVNIINLLIFQLPIYFALARLSLMPLFYCQSYHAIYTRKIMSFNTFNLDASILKAIQEAGYDQPTPIQTKSIPEIMLNKHVLASAQTGTGKTAAFVLPILDKLTKTRSEGRGPRVLIVSPTRELATQITDSIKKYSRYLRINSITITGGISYGLQNRMFSKPIDILVATPGRLLDLYQQKKINFKDLEAMILDEADRMLDMGFVPDIRKIYNATSKKQQMLMFSATFDAPIQKIAKEFLTEPVTISIKPDVSGHKNIKQLVYFSDNQTHKQQLLNHFIKNDEVTQAIIFTATKRMADQLSDQLYHSDIKTSALHGDMSQGSRTKTINRFKRNETKILVATDLASRGIDVQNISHVFNYDMPRFAEDYIHRIGRTGRANNKGIAISLVSPTDREFLRKIERFTNLKIDIASVEGLEPTILTESKAPKRKSRGRSFVKKGKVFKNEANAQKRIRSKPAFGKSSKPAFGKSSLSAPNR